MEIKEKIKKLKECKSVKERDKFILENLNKSFAKWLYQYYPINNLEILKEVKRVILK